MKNSTRNTNPDWKYSLGLVSLGVIAVFAITATWFASQFFARETIDSETRRLAKSWQFQIITTLDAGPRTFLDRLVEHDDQRIMRQLVHSTDIYRIALIDDEGTIFWSTSAELTGKKADAAVFAATRDSKIHVQHGVTLASALDGMESRFLAGKASPRDRHTVAVTMLPVNVGKDFAGAIELRLDNTQLLIAHKRNIQRATIVLCSVFAIIFLVAAWFSFRHNRQRQQDIAALMQARDQALEAETEAREMADQLQRVNEDVVTLNKELDRNIKELRKAQDEIIRKGKMAQIGQLTATIAHDIRNPLGAVRTAAFLIERKFANECQGIAKPLERINNGISRCDGIITELLEFARTNTITTERLPFDRWLLQNVQEQAERLPETVQIECHLALQDLEAEIDPGSMQRVLVNFLSNASEAMVGKGDDPAAVTTQNPKIVVSSLRTARGIELHVKDNGPGMSAELQAKVREPLFTTKKFGVGLGIPAVEKVLEQHGGGLDIQSQEGHGTTMIGWIPLQQRESNSDDEPKLDETKDPVLAA